MKRLTFVDVCEDEETRKRDGAEILYKIGRIKASLKPWKDARQTLMISILIRNVLHHLVP